jgi:hypothetical protein
VLIEDAMTAPAQTSTGQATLRNFEHVFGWVTSADAVMAALAQGADGEGGVVGVFTRGST